MNEDDFRRASLSVWEAMAPGWDERHAYFEEIARPVTERLLERLGPSSGDVVLDLAAGTGVVGFSAAPLVGAGGRVIVSDFAGGVVDAAGRRAEELGLDNVECRVLDAERLDLPDGSVDGVLCRWGYMLMPDPGSALRETRRVLQDEGRMACAVFAGPEQNRGRPYRRACSSSVATCRRWRSARRGSSRLPTASDSAASSRRPGSPSRDRGRPLRAPLRGNGRLLGLPHEAAGAIAMVLQPLSEAEVESVRGEIAEQLAPFERSGRIETPAVSLVAAAS